MSIIRYHGTPITPSAAAVQILRGRHGMVSFAHPDQIGLVAEVCQSFVLDNGAFSAWKSGITIDWKEFSAWIDEWRLHPGFSWYVMPDVIDGDESQNREMVEAFANDPDAVPVWHLHESLEWLGELCNRFRRIALGSSGDYADPGSEPWEERMNEAMQVICDDAGRPTVKVHGLRMMDPTIFSRYPFASVDSCNIARNIGIDQKWESFKYGGAIPKSTRGVIMADRCEAHAAASVWVASRREQFQLLFG